jgi:mycofactocin biosynthetic radical S-adenosylmethionine protein MftC
MAAKFFTGLPLDGPDPECVRGLGEAALATAGAAPRPSGDHSHRQHPATPGSGTRVPVPVSIGRRPDQGLAVRSVPDRACDPSPLAGFTP